VTASPANSVPATRHSFDQQPKESAKAFAAFNLYLNLGAERSLRAVGEKLGKSEGLIERWCSKFDWQARVQAHAAHHSLVERQATEALARTKAAEWLTRQQQVREEEWAIHSEAISAGREALKRFYERGKGATLGDIARILELASKLGRLASGMATDKHEVTGEIDVNFRTEVENAIKKVYGTVIDAEVVAEETK
jgi:hypothetical protein